MHVSPVFLFLINKSANPLYSWIFILIWLSSPTRSNKISFLEIVKQTQSEAENLTGKGESFKGLEISILPHFYCPSPKHTWVNFLYTEAAQVFSVIDCTGRKLLSSSLSSSLMQVPFLLLLSVFFRIKLWYKESYS